MADGNSEGDERPLLPIHCGSCHRTHTLVLSRPIDTSSVILYSPEHTTPVTFAYSPTTSRLTLDTSQVTSTSSTDIIVDLTQQPVGINNPDLYFTCPVNKIPQIVVVKTKNSEDPKYPSTFSN